MKTITILDAKAYALKQFSLFGKNQTKIKGEKVGKLQEELKILHSQCVFKAIRDIVKAKHIENQVDMTKLEIASWLHDVGYVIEKDDHSKHSLEMCEKEFELDDVLKDCILNH